MGLMDGFRAVMADLVEGGAADVNSSSDADEQSTQEGADTPKERTMYAGFSMDKTGKATGLAISSFHELVFAGTGAGKSRREIVPAIATWDGPVCAVSAKSDLAEMSADLRGRTGGPTYVMDLTGQADWSKIPDETIRLTNDPCALLVADDEGSTDDSALELAKLLTKVGADSGQGGGGGGDAAFWASLALGPLACMLQAGGWYPDPETGEDVWGGGIDWVMKAVLDYGSDESYEDGDELDVDTPSWDVAAVRATLMGSDHARKIMSTKQLEARQRDSVRINLEVALSSWEKRVVRRGGGEGGVAFSPSLLEDPGATLYIVSPFSSAAAGAAVAAIESLVEHWTLHAIKDGLPKLAMIIDEFTQTAPLPGASIMSHIALMRSYGVHFMLATQHSDALKAKYGEAMAKAIISIFPAILVGVGAIEEEIIKRTAWTVPPTERKVESFDSANRGSLASDRVEAIHPSELLPRDPSHGFLIVRGLPAGKVKLLDYTKL